MATFDERAATWDTPDRIERAKAVAASIRAALDIPDGARAVEVGAGTGLLGLELAGAVAELVLADTSEGMLEVADQKIHDRGLENVRTARLDLEADTRPDGAPFDLVLSLLTLHHVRDTRVALRRIRGLLRDGGHVALSDLDTEDGTFHSAEAEGIHHLGFDRVALGKLAEDAGFEDVRFSTAAVIRDDGRDYPLFLMTGRAG